MTTSLDYFFQSYLLSLTFWLGIPLGSLLILMMHTLTGGKWGEKIRPLLTQSSRGILSVGVLFIPLCLWGLPHLYTWSSGTSSVPGYGKHAYLSPSFFTLRTFIYFMTWYLVRRYFFKSIFKQRAASIGLIVMFLTVSFAAIDWIMSLESSWYSTVFGLLIITGMGVSALSFIILKAAILKKSDIAAQDLGNLLLAFIMVWAYLSFTQYLIMWMGNMPDETNWFMSRLHNGWGSLAASLILFQFFIPFFILLFRSVKRSLPVLGGVAALILFMHFVELYWIILPAVRHRFEFHIFDLISFVGVGCVWFYLRKPVVGNVL